MQCFGWPASIRMSDILARWTCVAIIMADGTHCIVPAERQKRYLFEKCRVRGSLIRYGLEVCVCARAPTEGRCEKRRFVFFFFFTHSHTSTASRAGQQLAEVAVFLCVDVTIIVSRVFWFRASDYDHRCEKKNPKSERKRARYLKNNLRRREVHIRVYYSLIIYNRYEILYSSAVAPVTTHFISTPISADTLFFFFSLAGRLNGARKNIFSSLGTRVFYIDLTRRYETVSPRLG